jgi:hypothetical protein
VEKLKKIVEESGMFSFPKNDHQSTTFYHAFHHDLTTKTPRSARTFSKTPLKTAAKTTKPRLTPGSHFF